MPTKLHCDVETYSELDLPSVGSFRYSEHESTRCLILAYAFGDDEPVAVDMTLPDWLRKLNPFLRAIQDGAIISAHNATFERNILTKVLNLPVKIQQHQWDCTAVRARLLSLPGSLDGCSKALGIENQKGPEGAALIQLFSKPGKRGRVLPSDQPEAFQRFIGYCKQDVRVEQELDRVLPPMPEVERRAFQVDYIINDRGMPVNLPAVKAGIDFVAEYSEKLVTRAIEISGCRPTQREKTLEFLKTRGLNLPNLQAATVEHLGTTPGLPPDIAELVEARIELSRAGTKKLITIRDSVSDDNRIRGGFLFSAASTRRWSSTGVQLHNLQSPQGNVNPLEVVEFLLSGKTGQLVDKYPRPLTAIAQSIRAFFQAEEYFRIVDYSSVEPRGLAWLADEKWLLEAYHRDEDAYKIMAGKVYHIPPENVDKRGRFIGKQLVLGCFSAETKVLTDSGWKPITTVTAEDRVFDGEEFVNHTGVVPRGIKGVIERWGVQATPNHKVFSGQHWFPFEQISEQDYSGSWQLALSTAALSLRRIGLDLQEVSTTMNVGVHVDHCPSPVQRETYDISNAGPRNRFVILTDKGPLIVHNCGYMMGPPKFVASCAKFGEHISDEVAVTAVRGYRNSVPAIVKFWADIEAAAIKATKYWMTIRFGKLKFRPALLGNGYPILYLDMPSGSLAYANPSIGKEVWNGRERDTFEYFTTLGSSFVKTDAFGGLLAENVTQALTRDVLRDGLIALNDNKFVIPAHVHDEALTEGPDSQDDLKEQQRLMCNSSPWAEGFPIASAGEISKVYKK
jgi:hypothetical protein